eukprot:SAG11_NODE_14161_length_622_cov_13.313576_2_plen_28_part_01
MTTTPPRCLTDLPTPSVADAHASPNPAP